MKNQLAETGSRSATTNTQLTKLISDAAAAHKTHMERTVVAQTEIMAEKVEQLQSLSETRMEAAIHHCSQIVKKTMEVAHNETRNTGERETNGEAEH